MRMNPKLNEIFNELMGTINDFPDKFLLPSNSQSDQLFS